MWRLRSSAPPALPAAAGPRTACSPTPLAAYFCLWQNKVGKLSRKKKDLEPVSPVPDQVSDSYLFSQMRPVLIALSGSEETGS